MAETAPIDVDEIKVFIAALALVAQHGRELEVRDFAPLVGDRAAALDTLWELTHGAEDLRRVSHSVAVKLAVAADSLPLSGSAPV